MTDVSMGSAAAAAKIAEAASTGPVLAADGTPLKRVLQRALRREKLRALMLIAPLLIFVLVSFIAPIADMLFRSVENEIVAETLPRTVDALDDWDYTAGQAPGEDVFAALYVDLFEAEEFKIHTRLGSRLNYETTGVSSLFRKTGRGVGRMDTDEYTKAFEALDPAWDAIRPHGSRSMGAPGIRIGAARNRVGLGHAGSAVIDQPGATTWPPKTPEDVLYTTLYRDLTANASAVVTGYSGPRRRPAEGRRRRPPRTSRRCRCSEQFVDIDEDWGNVEVWGTIKAFSPKYTPGYFLAAVDLQETPAGIESQPDDQKIYILLFKRTLFMSLVIMGSCILLGYPIAYLLANLPLRTSNLLLILVLLPFWTSLLVRTSRLEGAAAAAGRDQRHPGLGRHRRRRQPAGDDQQPVRHHRRDDAYPAAVHDPAALFGDEDDPADLCARRQIAGRDELDGVLAGLFPAVGARHRRGLDPRLHPGHRLLHHAGARRRHHRYLHLEPDRLSHLVARSTGVLPPRLGTILLAVVLVLYWVYDKIVGIDNVSLG